MRAPSLSCVDVESLAIDPAIGRLLPDIYRRRRPERERPRLSDRGKSFGRRGGLLSVGLALLPLLMADPGFAESRNALGLVVDGCRLSKQAVGMVFPCLSVDAPPIDRGYAVLRPPGSATEVLVVPTAAIPGIESPILLEPDAPDYVQAAWSARRYVTQALGQDPGWSAIGMAVNSKPGRSQDRLHIHVDCVEPSVRNQLARLKRGLGSKWAPLPISLRGASYWARTVTAAEFSTTDPFASMASGVPNARRSMRNMTLAVLGATFDDGTTGFYFLASQAHTRRGTSTAEDLLDHSCRIKTP